MAFTPWLVERLTFDCPAFPAYGFNVEDETLTAGEKQIMLQANTILGFD